MHLVVFSTLSRKRYPYKYWTSTRITIHSISRILSLNEARVLAGFVLDPDFKRPSPASLESCLLSFRVDLELALSRVESGLLFGLQALVNPVSGFS